VLSTGHNRQLQLFFKRDLRSVVAMKRDVLEYDPERAFHLSIRFGHGIAVAHGPTPVRHGHVIDRPEQRFLLCCTGVDKLLSVEIVALLIDIRESIQKVVLSSGVAHSVKIKSINSLTRAPFAPGVSVSGIKRSIIATVVAF